MNNFLLDGIKKDEFTSTKKLFLKFFRNTLDGIDIIESLHWFSGFNNVNYNSKNLKNPEDIYQYFKSLEFCDFKAYSDNIQKVN